MCCRDYVRLQDLVFAQGKVGLGLPSIRDEISNAWIRRAHLGHRRGYSSYDICHVRLGGLMLSL